MTDSPGYEAVSHQPPAPTFEDLPLPLPALRRRLGLLQWLVPAGLLLLVVAYEIGPSRWIHDRMGDTYHFVAEILVYGTVGPVLAFILLDFLGRWLEERETSDLQAQVLARAREQARLHRQLSDDTLQALFAVSLRLTTLESSWPDLPPEAAAQVRETQAALNQAIQQLNARLTNEPH
jgi:signal transduction histidine kinase